MGVAGANHRYTTNFISMPGFSWSDLNSYLRQVWPVIVGICYDGSTCNSTHFFVVVYGDGSNNEANYWINDPGNGQVEAMNTYQGDYLGWTALYQWGMGPTRPHANDASDGVGPLLP
jgi:Papain-like cysteine protease AvrRpt2